MQLSGFTWYDLLGVLPGASKDQINSAYRSKLSLLRPTVLSGAQSDVVAAASCAERMLDAAWSALGDPATRQSYDEAIGVRRTGGGLGPRENIASQPGWTGGMIPGISGAAALEAMLALADWLAPQPHLARRVAVPDVRGLFYSVALEVTGRKGLHLVAVRLTENPMPVDGLIVDQRPRSPAKIRRDGELTVRVWHPPARSVRGA